MNEEEAMIAYKIADEAHKGQTRWNWEPYISHPYCVGHSFLCDDIGRSIGFLHDVLEDTEITEADLRKQLPREIVDAVVLLTKGKDEDYADYILRIKDSNNQAAIDVKLADLHHNLSDLKKGSLRDKYKLARLILQGI